MGRAITESGPYQKKLLKLLPSESVAAYLAAINIIPNNDISILLNIIVLGIITVLTPFYLINLMEMTLKDHLTQILFITFSFVVWAFAINGERIIPVLSNYLFLKSLVLILWTACIPLFFRSKPQP